MFQSFSPTELRTPHIPLRIDLADGLTILESMGVEIMPMDGRERGFQASRLLFSAAVYSAGDKVDSVWYNDTAGRFTAHGKRAKIDLYLSRYGLLSDWEMRMENGWMRYWYNPTSKAAMVYGIDKDVLRFNMYDGD
jgi:hypothetical protein